MASSQWNAVITNHEVQHQLTTEQLERIEKNRQDALKRRQAALERVTANNIYGESAQGSENGFRSTRKRQRTSSGGMNDLKATNDNLPPPYTPKVPSSTTIGSLKQSTALSRSDFELSEEQMKVLQAVARQQSVFLTGCAGTGKSFVLEFAIRQLRAMHGSDSVHVTASTGLAACALSGITLHSFAGVGLGNEPRDELVHKVQTRRETRRRWQEARALIIDEVSMVDMEFFDNLDYIARKIRKSSKPFGGIQLLVTGDFFQLPPVNKESNNKSFAFEAECWDSCFNLQMELTHVFRQSDQTFVNMLNEIREGVVSPQTRDRLISRVRCSLSTADGIMLTKLYPFKADVSRENYQRLQELQELQMVYNSKDEGKSEHAKRQLQIIRAEKCLTLRCGAQVMLLKNLDCSQGLANGARGVVVGFCDPSHPSAPQFRHLAPAINPSGMWPVVRFACDHSERVIGPESWAVEEYGQEIAKRWQVPLSLAWALSVHKCQGMTLDRVETDLRGAFDYGMVYVALSRVRSLEGLQLIGFDPNKIKVHPKVIYFYKRLHRYPGKLRIES